MSNFAQTASIIIDMQTSYDAWYVAVAEELGYPLGTLDRHLAKAVGQSASSGMLSRCSQKCYAAGPSIDKCQDECQDKNLLARIKTCFAPQWLR